jgi:hypothetical protein
MRVGAGFPKWENFDDHADADVARQLRPRLIMALQVPVSEYGSGFWRSVIWWESTSFG